MVTHTTSMALVVAVVVICVCAATGVSTVLTLMDSLGLLKRVHERRVQPNYNNNREKKNVTHKKKHVNLTTIIIQGSLWR